MIKNHLTRRTIAMFFLCNFLSIQISNNFIFGQSSGPNAPEAAAFEPVDATDMVNLVTGNMSYVLPLINIPSPEGGYPLALSYHSGIAVDQDASWVGLGWNLNPGAINRIVNGYPDDWSKTNFKEFFYDKGWDEDFYEFSAGATFKGTLSVGLGLSWGSNQSLGGYVSASIGLGGDNGASLGGYIGTNGVGVNAGYAGFKASISTNGVGVGYNTEGNISLGLGLNYSYNSGFSGGVSMNVKHGKYKNGWAKGGTISSGIGIGFSSKGVSSNLKIRGYGMGISADAGDIDAGDYHVISNTNEFFLPAFIFYIGFNHTNIEYSLYKYNDLYTSGILYPVAANNLSHKSGATLFENHFMDINIIQPFYDGVTEFNDLIEEAREDERNNLMLPSYDNYSVGAQGLSGNITPYNHVDLILSGRGKGRQFGDLRDSDVFVQSLNYSFEDYKNNLTGDDLGELLTLKQNFTFINNHNSFLRTQKENLLSNEIEQSINKITGTDVLNLYKYNKDLSSFDNSKSLIDSKKLEGNSIITYTNKDIRDNHLLNFIEAKEGNSTLNRHNTKIFLDDGIGAFKITTLDGKTYHYSLPVYQFESVYKNFKKVNGKGDDVATEDDNFYEIQKNTPYATHWLLTAITGPDYVDINENGSLDVDDYGYWVEFDYGKWSDGYIWRTPNGRVEENIDKKDSKKSTYSYKWGRKQLYYLDAIKTRTHTALFVKKTRLDGFGNEKKTMQSFNVNDFVNQSKGYSSKRTVEAKQTFYTINGNEVNLPCHNIPAGQGQTICVYPLLSESTIRNMYTPKTVLLGLDKILLFQNDKLQNFNKSKLSIREEKGYSISTRAYKFNDTYFFKNKSVLKEFDVNIYDNVITVEDIKDLGIEENAQEVIEFKHDYSLTDGTPNSFSGRLSLKELLYKGKRGNQLIPPYTFNYGVNNSYDKDDIDDWGYNKKGAESWSLNNIIMPTGGEINIVYENDIYKEAIYNNSTYKVGGGIRTKSILVNDGVKNIAQTNYNYYGGLTSYAPSKEQKGVPYASELPSPLVMYSKVEMLNLDGKGDFLGKTEYNFETLEEKQNENGYIFSLGECFRVKEDENIIFDNGKVISNKYTIESRLGNLGRINSISVYNKKLHLLSKVENNYKIDLENDGEIGVTQESFSSYKRVAKNVLTSNYEKFYVSSTSKIDYPSVLESVEKKSGNHSVIEYFDEYDFLTGQLLESRTYSSDGRGFKRKVVPAFKKYDMMGSKLYDVDNKNMLIQTAGEISYILKDGRWKEIGASVTTWNNNWVYLFDDNSSETSNDVWRKHKTYIWNGKLASDSTYDNFVEFDYNSSATNLNWKKTSETTKYNQFSQPLEVKDINANYISTKMGDNYTKVMAISNAAYEDIYYSSAEYTEEGSHQYLGGNVLVGTATARVLQAHTGSYSMQIDAGKKSFQVDIPRKEERNTDLKKRFKVSVWVRKVDENKTKILLNTSQKPFNVSEKVYAGNWVQLNGYINIPIEGASVAITCTSGTIYADDFRLHPISSSMISYVYNEWDEVSYIMGSNGLSTHYIYDTAGRLVETQVEVIDKVLNPETEEEKGGFKKVSRNSYNYKRNNN
ncbi:hypothetical protein [Tenacibaculum sp. M341]|uniref:hypothetical protein n=1 Tax=Tenacibaculum sp. M341 TaxID=2530339 RepID=UPI0010448AAB|nr:hypothetical protein [Tenacibaculum sp. M341]TCI90297.1 hypothetical protein EYW44_13760 [Tenacibaculum sp. M341]